MKTLTIDISQTDKERDPLKVRVSFSDPEDPSQYENVKADTILPFRLELEFPAVLMALEQREFSPTSYSDDQVDWLLKKRLLYELDGQLYLSDERRKRIGKLLYDAIVPEDSLRYEFRQALKQAHDTFDPLHLEIKFSADERFIGAHPWELLYDGEDYLCGGGLCTMTRYIAIKSTQPKREVQQGLKILMISPRPNNLPEILGSSEAKCIKDALSNEIEAGNVHVDELDPPTFEQLKIYLSRNSGADLPHIIHFDGHGTFGRSCSKCRNVISSTDVNMCPGLPNRPCGHPLEDTPQGYLAFQNAQQSVEYVSANQLARQVGQAAVSMGGGKPVEGLCVVMLSACKSALALRGESVFNGVAQRLINAGIPAVVAMQFTINEKEAADFAAEFYRRITKGDSLVNAVAWGWTNLDPESDQWYRPVLYLRWRDNEGGKLFHITQLPRANSLDEPTEHDDNPSTSTDTFPLAKPEYFVTLTQRFIPGEGRPEEIAVDQKGIVMDFARMLIPDWRKDVNWHIMMVEAPQGSGKSLALRRLEYIGNYVRQRQEQPLILCHIDFAELMAVFPAAIGLKILRGLRDDIQANIKPPHNAGLLLDAQINEIDPPGVSSTEIPQQRWDKDTLTKHLYRCLSEISKEFTVVLLFDDYHKIMHQEAGEWLIRSFLAAVGRGTYNIIVVIMSEPGMVDVETKPEGAKPLQAISDSLIDDVKDLSRLLHKGHELDTDVASNLIANARLLSGGHASMGALRVLLETYWIGRSTA